MIIFYLIEPGYSILSLLLSFQEIARSEHIIEGNTLNPFSKELYEWLTNF